LGQDDTAEQGGSTESDASAETTNASGTEVANVTDGQYGQILDMLAQGEVSTTSKSGYDTIAHAARAHAPSKPITQMTIGEILAWQEQIDNRPGVYSEAAGRYQIVEDTLRGFNNNKYPNLQAAINGGEGQTPLYERTGLSTGDKFSPENQDKMAITLLEGRGIKRFLAGSMTQYDFHTALAQEWASLSQVGKRDENGNIADMISHYESAINTAKVNLGTITSTLQQLKGGGPL
jgi:muramidase (phage lysozyme)